MDSTTPPQSPKQPNTGAPAKAAETSEPNSVAAESLRSKPARTETVPAGPEVSVTSGSGSSDTGSDAVSPNASLTNGNSAAISNDLFYARVFAVVATGILGFALYEIVAPFFGPLMWALFLAFLLHPVQVRLTRRLGNRENVSAGLLTFLAFVMLIGPLTAMSAAFAAQAGDLVQWVQATLAKQTRQQYRLVADAPVIGPALEWMRDNFGIRTAQIQGWIQQGTQHLPQFLAGMSGKIFLGAVNTVFAFVIMLFMFFFFVRDGASLVSMLRDLIPMKPVRRQQLVDHVANVTRAVVFGTGLTVLVQGALVGIAFLITGLSGPLVFGVLAAFLALLPFGGTALVWIPATLLLASQDNWGMAIVMLVIGVVSSSIDNVLRPMLISGRAEVDTLSVFIGVLGGAAAFGPIGIFLGPVIISLIIALIGFAREQRASA
jgi:predicted PurR-regulated permease PerM